MKMTVAQAMVKCLEQEQIQTVFGYPGAAICPFYDALLNSPIEHLLIRQEQMGGHCANGLARVTGRPQVCIATSGPGALNLITGIATAYMDSIPLVCITGQVNSDQLGKDVFQEADITGAVEPFSKYSYIVKDGSQIARIFKEAFYLAGTGRPGPVVIDVPTDIQNQTIDFEYPETISMRSYKPTVVGNARQITRAAAALKKAKRPLIVAGGGIFAAGAVEELNKLAAKSGHSGGYHPHGQGSRPGRRPLLHGHDRHPRCGQRQPGFGPCRRPAHCGSPSGGSLHQGHRRDRPGLHRDPPGHRPGGNRQEHRPWTSPLWGTPGRC